MTGGGEGRGGPFACNENIRNRGRLSSRGSAEFRAATSDRLRQERKKKNTFLPKAKAVDNILVAARESGPLVDPAGFNRDRPSAGPTAALLGATRVYLRVSECYYKWKYSWGSLPPPPLSGR